MKKTTTAVLHSLTAVSSEVNAFLWPSSVSSTVRAAACTADLLYVPFIIVLPASCSISALFVVVFFSPGFEILLQLQYQEGEWNFF